MTERKNGYQISAPARAAPLPTLSKRTHVRVLLPPSVSVYVRMRLAGSAAAGARGVVSDISAGGLAMTMIEGGHAPLPQEGQEVELRLDYEGGEAVTPGRVVRASARSLSAAFPPAERDEEMNVELLSLIARVISRRVEHLDRSRLAGSLAARLTHQHFHGAGHLDLRVQTEPPGWWQVVFLDYLIAWSAQVGAIETGVLDRTLAAALLSDPLAAGDTVRRHATPWASLVKVVSVIAARCVAVQPAHADAFTFMQETLG